MKIELVQFAPTFPGREKNWECIHAWAEQSPADIVVFPELSSCGYMYESPKELEPFADAPSALSSLEKLSARTGKLVVGGFAERDGKRLYNAAYAIGPESTSVYHKIHLWNREKLLFQPGDQPCIIEFEGRRIGIEICYDIQFPELTAYLSRHGAELILAPTAWAADKHGPSHGLYPYAFLAMASAYAYGICIAVVNRTGVERGALFPGQSCLADPWGKIATLGRGQGKHVLEIPFDEIPRAKRPGPYNDLQTDHRMIVFPPAPVQTSSPRRAAGKRRPKGSSKRA